MAFYWICRGQIPYQECDLSGKGWPTGRRNDVDVLAGRMLEEFSGRRRKLIASNEEERCGFVCPAV
ncbi:hypothetical protein ACLOJK_028397 [Asimina triloba]